MEREQFTFYRSFAKAVQRIRKKADRTEAYDAIVNYALDGIEPDIDKLPDMAAAVFLLCKPNLDAARRKAEGGKRGSPAKDIEKITERYEEDTANKKEKKKEKENKIKKEGENECSSPPCGGPPSPAKPVRHKYGEYENVLLSDDDLEKLKAEFPDWQARIERLSEHIASRGTVYKSHLATIRSWARRDNEGVGSPVRPVSAGRKETGFQTSNPFLEMLEERRQAK